MCCCNAHSAPPQDPVVSESRAPSRDTRKKRFGKSRSDRPRANSTPASADNNGSAARQPPHSGRHTGRHASQIHTLSLSLTTSFLPRQLCSPQGRRSYSSRTSVVAPLPIGTLGNSVIPSRHTYPVVILAFLYTRCLALN